MLFRLHFPNFTSVAALLLCLFAVFNAVADEAIVYPPVTVGMEPVQVSKHVWYVQGEPGVASDNEGFISNAGFIVTGAGVVVFDALGSPSLANTLLQKIRTITSEPIVRVIVSHYHADHVYGLQVFEELGAEILAPAGADRYLASEQSAERLEERRFTLDPWVNDSTRLVYPDALLEEGMHFRLGDVEFVVTVVGDAHSEGDLTLFVVPDRVLFSGDIIFEGRVPFLGDANSARWVRVLERMEQEKLVALVPGHGGVAEDPDEAIGLTRRYLMFLRERMGAAVDAFESFDSAYAATDWGEFEMLPAFAEANRRNAYQVYLAMEAELLGAD